MNDSTLPTADTLRRYFAGKFNAADTWVALAEARMTGASADYLASIIRLGMTPAEQCELRIRWAQWCDLGGCSLSSESLQIVVALREADPQRAYQWPLPLARGHEAIAVKAQRDRFAALLRQVNACPQAAPWLARINDPATGLPLWQAIREALGDKA